MERIIERSEEIIPKFLTEKQFNILRANYRHLFDFTKNTIDDVNLTPNQKSVKIYDEFERFVPAFFSRFYCITGRAYLYDLRENPWEENSAQEMLSGIKRLFDAAKIDMNDWFMDKYLNKNDFPQVILKSIDTGVYWLITKRFIDTLLDYLTFVKEATDFKTYCRTVRGKFLWTKWWIHRFVTAWYPDAYGGSVEDIRANFEY